MICPSLAAARFPVARGPNEYVDLRKIIDTTGIYALTAMEVLQL